ncbi:hypothetical protein ScPMuIL_001631 [Solemya velum]
MTPKASLQSLANLLPKDVEYHAYASYSHHNDLTLIGPIVTALENLGIKFYDPERDAMLGEFVFKNIVDRGISVCRTTVLFLTKNFVCNKWCHYEANIALKRYIMTKGKCRVIPIVLQPCAVPKYMKILNCVHAWKYHGKDLLKRILKLLTAPSLKYRRARWIGIKSFHRTTNIVKKLRFNHDDIRELSIPNFLLSLQKIPAILPHCIIQCRYGRCQFACVGTSYLEIHKHMQKCRYFPVKCKNNGCLHTGARGNMDMHLKACQFKVIACRFTGCNARCPQNKMNIHEKKCDFRLVPCNKRESGCLKIISKKDLKKHLQSCEYESVTCEECNTCLIRRDFELHTCCKSDIICSKCGAEETIDLFQTHNERCSQFKIKCKFVGCTEVCIRKHLKVHEVCCRYRLFRCQNRGCSFEGYETEIEFHMERMCDYRLSVCKTCGKTLLHKSRSMHRFNCDPIVVCADCGASITSSSKTTHERYICPNRKVVSICEICKKSIPFDKYHSHTESHRLNMESAASFTFPGACGGGISEISSHSHTSELLGTSVNVTDSVEMGEKPRRHSSDPEYSLETFVFVLASEVPTEYVDLKNCKTPVVKNPLKSSAVLKFRELLRQTEKHKEEIKALLKTEKKY